MPFTGEFVNEVNATRDERRHLLSVQSDGEELDRVGDSDVLIQQSGRTGSSWFASVFLVVNAALGAGLLNFPQAYQQAGGVLTAIVIQAIFLVFIVTAIMILAYCSDIKGACTYQDVVSTVCGKNAQRASAVFLTTYCFGTCITFLIIIGDQWEAFFLSVAKKFYCTESPIYMDRSFTIVVTSLILILPLCFPKRIDFLKYASFIGVLGIIYVVVLVTAKYFLPHDKPDHITTKPAEWIDVFLVVPTICFAYQCHVSIIPIYSCMEPRNLKQFSKTVAIAMTLCVVTYTGTAAFGFLTFGDAITQDILLSYDQDVPVIIAVVLIAIKTYTTYPILLFCGRAAFECLWTDLRGLTPETIVRQERLRRITTTLIWFTATLALAVFIPNIGVVIELLGAFAAVFIFVFPGMCLLASTLSNVETEGWTRLRKFLVVFSCCFLTLGAFIFGLTLTQSVLNITKGVSADKSKFTC